MKSGFMLTALPHLQVSTVPQGGGIPEPMVPSTGKKEPKVDIQHSQHYKVLPRRHTQVSLHEDQRENLQGSTTGNKIERDKGDRAYRNQNLNLGRLHFCLELFLSRYPSRYLEPWALPVFKAKSMALSSQGAQLAVLPGLGTQSTSRTLRGIHSISSGQGRRLKAPPNC